MKRLRSGRVIVSTPDKIQRPNLHLGSPDLFLGLPGDVWQSWILCAEHFTTQGLLRQATVCRVWHLFVFGAVRVIRDDMPATSKRYLRQFVNATEMRLVTSEWPWSLHVQVCAHQIQTLVIDHVGTHNNSCPRRLMTRFTRLTSLTLDRDFLVEDTTLVCLTTLRTLNLLACNALTPRVNLDKLRALTHLTLLTRPYSTSSLMADTLGRMTHLRSLRFMPYYTPTSLSFVAAYTFLSSLQTSLTHLDLSLTTAHYIIGSAEQIQKRRERLLFPLSVISRMSQLTSLTLSGNPYVPGTLLAPLTGLTSLKIGYRDDANDLASIRGMRNLRMLSFLGHRQITSIDAIEKLYKEGCLPNLVSAFGGAPPFGIWKRPCQ